MGLVTQHPSDKKINQGPVCVPIGHYKEQGNMLYLIAVR
jgi:hypothetical protein